MGVPREKLRSEITEVLPGMHYKLIYYRTVKKKRISNICQINIKKKTCIQIFGASICARHDLVIMMVK